MLIKGHKALSIQKGDILLIQLGDIGDVVLTIPTIRALRDNFPENSLILCVREKAKGLIEDCPWSNGIISVNKQKRSIKGSLIYQKNFVVALRKYHFDLAIDLRTGTRGAIIAVLSGASCRIGRFAENGQLWRNRFFTHLVRPEDESNQYSADHNLNIITPFDLEVNDRLPRLVVSAERKENARIILTQENVPLDKAIIAIHPFSLWKYKEWAINKWVSLIDHIRCRYDFSVIITGSDEERVRAEEMLRRCRTKVSNVAGKTSVGTLPAVLQACGLFIGVDTAALHIAAAVGTPTVGIFGPSSPANWAPRGERHCVISKAMSCVPCKQKGCQGSEVSRCLEELSFEEVNERVDVHIARTIA